MTCIVAGKGWMAADRCVTEADGAKGSLVKIAKNPHLIAAAAGNATSTLDVRRAIRKGCSSVEDLIEHVDKDSLALVLLPSGAVHKVQDGRVWPAESGLAGIGSGADLAVGWLAGMFWNIGNVDPTRYLIRQAFSFVEKRRTDCGRGVDIRTFETGLAAVPRP
jgi:hypothetical protein